MDFKKNILVTILLAAAATHTLPAKEMLQKLLVKERFFNEENARIYVENLDEETVKELIDVLIENETIRSGSAAVTRLKNESLKETV